MKESTPLLAKTPHPPLSPIGERVRRDSDAGEGSFFIRLLGRPDAGARAERCEGSVSRELLGSDVVIVDAGGIEHHPQALDHTGWASDVVDRVSDATQVPRKHAL